MRGSHLWSHSASASLDQRPTPLVRSRIDRTGRSAGPDGRPGEAGKMSPGVLSQIERGVRAQRGLRQLDVIAGLLGVRLSDILRFSESWAMEGKGPWPYGGTNSPLVAAVLSTVQSDTSLLALLRQAAAPSGARLGARTRRLRLIACQGQSVPGITVSAALTRCGGLMPRRPGLSRPVFAAVQDDSASCIVAG